MHHFIGAITQRVTLRSTTLRIVISCCAVTVLLARGAVPASQAAVCSLDIAGNGRLDGTTDGLLVVRYLPGIRGAALVSGALGLGAARTLPDDVERCLATPCALGGWVGQGTGRLNDTGLTFGGEPLTGNNATCTSSSANIAQ